MKVNNLIYISDIANFYLFGKNSLKAFTDRYIILLMQGMCTILSLRCLEEIMLPVIPPMMSAVG